MHMYSEIRWTQVDEHQARVQHVAFDVLLAAVGKENIINGQPRKLIRASDDFDQAVSQFTAGYKGPWGFYVHVDPKEFFKED